MASYIIPRKDFIEHYFYKPYEGICSSQKTQGRWSPHQSLYKEGIDGFCVYTDNSDNVHMICTNDEGDLIYFINKDNIWHKHVISKGNKKIFPQDIHMSVQNERINLLYSAKHNDNVLLIYCILGMSSQPMNIDTLSNEYTDFCIFGTRVYYTNKDTTLGYQDFADGKPNMFIPIAKNAYMPCLLEHDGKEVITYKSNEQIIFNDQVVFDDKYAAYPILTANLGKLLIFWKSISFIRYTSSQNCGATWSVPMRFMSSGKSTQIFYVQSQNTTTKYYGNMFNNELNILGAPDILADVKNHMPKQENISSTPDASISDSKGDNINEHIEIQKLKIMLEIMRNEIVDLKKQITFINETITELQKSIQPDPNCKEQDSEPQQPSHENN